MIVEFEDQDLAELIETGRNGKYRKYSKNRRFMSSLYRVYGNLTAVACTRELKDLSYLHYEQLSGNYAGRSSVRVMNGMVERLIFREVDDGIRITCLKLNTDHYGNKN